MREKKRGRDGEDRVHTLRLFPRCLPFLRCCVSTEKTHTHTTAMDTAQVGHTQTHRRGQRDREGQRDGYANKE